ncbi:MAG: hypothetical protein PHD72_02025 [Patescibacteria group bacterium]|nr:hypothetical protein [Patescibacteria group bacterium]
MIGKTAWFQRRKYGGWGIFPKTWQGWVYIVAAIIPLAIFQYIPFLTAEVRFAATTVWVVVLLLDVFHIMVNLNRDEREYKIEAISERNSAWAMVLMVGIGVAYQSFNSIGAEVPNVDPFLIAVLAVGVLAKAISNIYYSRKSL